MRQLDYIWRLGTKLLALAFIFAGGGFLAIVLLPIAMIIPGERCERTQTLVHMSFRFYLWILQGLGLLTLNIEGAEKLKGGGKIVIANHPSLLDVVILMSLIPKAQCIVKHELWNHWSLGVLMRRAEYIRNDLEPEQILAACKASMDQGRTLIIFPEGTRTKPGTMPNFNRGFANIALLTETPILPVYINCNPPHLYKGEPWWQVPPKRPVYDVVVGETLDVKTYVVYGPRSLAVRKLIHSIGENYARMIDHGRSGT